MTEEAGEYCMLDTQTHCIEVIEYGQSPPVDCLSLAVRVIKR